MIGLYVHLPFCKRKCPYCDFYSLPCDNQTLMQDYVKAICDDMSQHSGKGIKADTLYFGGGTPSLLKPEQVYAIIERARAIFSLNGEITMEANPSSVDESYLKAVKTAGVNRISFGMQSLDDNELKALSRLHDAQGAVDSIEIASKIGFNSISADLMIGTPYQTAESLQRTIDRLVSLPINHISAYMLKVEAGTPYEKSDIIKHCAEDEQLADMYIQAVKNLESYGFGQYEISNFAKNGAVSEHNLKYWRCQEYLGFGAAAHSYFGGMRYMNKPDAEAYCKSFKNIQIVTDASPGQIDEIIMLGLRLNEGIALDKVKRAEGFNYSAFLKQAEKLSEKGFLELSDNRIRLTLNGLLMSNIVIGMLVNV